MSPHSDTLSWFRVNQFLFLLFNVACLPVEANTNVRVFDLILPWFKPTIYSTPGEHSNHYTTNAILWIYLIHFFDNNNFLLSMCNLYIMKRSQIIISFHIFLYFGRNINLSHSTKSQLQLRNSTVTSQRHSVINHCDRRITHLGDLDISFVL